MIAQAVQQRKFSGLRPVDHSRDMGQVAALMEEAFGGNLTRQGEEALREMKIMSYFGPFLWLLDRTSPGFHETFRGFVWIEEGCVVGNVNVGRLAPHSRRWLVSNVAVRSDYQGRSIAHHLVQAAIDLAREHGGKWAVLQVHTDNVPACKLYQHLGFEQIAAVTELHLERVRPVAITGSLEVGVGSEPESPTCWDLPRRPLNKLRTPIPSPYETPKSRPSKERALRRRGYSEWRKEYELALAATSEEARWLNPVRADQFMIGLDQRLSRWLDKLFTGREEHRLAVENGGHFVATLTVFASRWRGEHRLELVVHPDHRGQLEEMLVTKALDILKDYPQRGVAVSHPAEHQEAIAALKLGGFIEKRTLAQMRLALIRD